MDIAEKTSRIEKLKMQIAECKRCRLHKTRSHTVPGEGSLDAEVMFIGEAPGRNEDLQGKPFVGRAGNIFDQLLTSVGFSREDIYLCNILKCRPPENRNPLSDEVHSCVGSLDIQLRIVSPKVVATLGNYATTYIFEKFSLEPVKISQVHGQVFVKETPLGTIKIVPLYHPAVATYDPSKIDILLKDFRVFTGLSQSNDVKEGQYPRTHFPS